MTTKADFNAEEWDQVQQGPAVAGLLVIAADRGGTVRESFSVAKAYANAAQEAGSGLLGDIASDAPHLDKEKLKTNGSQLISEAVAVLEEKGTPDEVDQFKRFCLDVAEHAAEATKSGGFLGIGGKRISQAESAALDTIAGILGIERTSSGPAPADVE